MTQTMGLHAEMACMLFRMEPPLRSLALISKKADDVK